MNYRSGQGFLDLLSRLVGTETEKFPDDIRMVPNPVWDVMNSSAKGPLLPGQRVAQRNCDTMRTALLTAFVWHTLLAFYGEIDTNKVPMKLKDTTGNSDFVKEAWRRAQREASPALAAQLKEARKKTKEEVKEYRRTAQRRMPNQGLEARQATTQEDMRQQIGSRRQLHGTLTGSPEHLTLLTVGLPEPGFTRSLYLLYQLKTLDKNPDYDYLLVRSKPEFQTDRALIFPPEMATVKILLRNNLRVAVCRYAPKDTDVPCGTA
ncbi:hypothetical protein D9758_016125 [Tetrapyrgos nigripes]|uniref:Uncharacterized protein n=1 Tax=Tetrapyrgos nigripes TaxID=182062 RepID=A0A8H5FD05_9AGAR|nr:hypothetical protein D9758_016125 [Tetrapyrgos nigripes]